MSTAARKARKRTRKRWGYESAEATRSYPEAGPFQHPVKTGTPFLLRAENQPHAYYDSARQSQPFGVPARVRAAIRNRLKVLTGTEDGQEAAPAKELDPKPYRIGRKRYSLEDLADRSIEAEAGRAAEFAPRRQYAQGKKAYGF